MVIKALAHPTRLFIVEELVEGPRCVCELTAMVGDDISTVSRHLAVLRNAGIVDDELMSFITAGGALLDDYIAGMPIARVGQVEDIAEAVRFLAGPESSWITGVNLVVDGGVSLVR